MKTKGKNKSKKTLMQELREIRDKINVDIKDMSREQLKKYLNNKKTLHSKTIWNKNK